MHAGGGQGSLDALGFLVQHQADQFAAVGIQTAVLPHQAGLLSRKRAKRPDGCGLGFASEPLQRHMQTAAELEGDV